jgi:hypothetical protein
LSASCGKSKKTVETANKPIPLSELTIEKMKLSKGLNLKLPSTLKNLGKTSSNLSLSSESAGKKSEEACRTADRVNIFTSMLSGIGEEFCHLEAESANIEFGKKYKITLDESDDLDNEYSLWVDNSSSDKLTVYQCYDNKLALKISINSATEAGAKGALKFAFNDDDGNDTTTYKYDMNFDLSIAGQKELSSSFTVKNNSTDYADAVAMTLLDNGVSRFSSAFKGIFEGVTVAMRGFMKHNGSQGQAAVKYAATTPQSGEVNFSTKSTFNSDGILVDNNAAANDVKVLASELPNFLASGFTIEEPTGWDCQTTESLTIRLKTGPSAAAHNACTVSEDNVSFDQCDGEDYAVGEAEEIAD